MTAKRLTQREYAIKAQFRHLIMLLGGYEAAAAIAGVRVSKTMLHSYGDAMETTVFPAIDVVDALETELGSAPVTNLLSQRQEKPAHHSPDLSPVDIIRLGHRVQQEVLEFEREVMDGAADGEIDNGELDRCIKEAEDIVMASNHAHQSLCNLKSARMANGPRVVGGQGT